MQRLGIRIAHHISRSSTNVLLHISVWLRKRCHRVMRDDRGERAAILPHRRRAWHRRLHVNRSPWSKLARNL